LQKVFVLVEFLSKIGYKIFNGQWNKFCLI